MVMRSLHTTELGEEIEKNTWLVLFKSFQFLSLSTMNVHLKRTFPLCNAD